MRGEREPHLITAGLEHQDLAPGFPVGKRFKSAEVIRRSDNRWRHLGHFHEADGRWRKLAPTEVRPWTDDYVNLFGALIRQMKGRG